MKNKFFFLGSLCLVLALGLVLFACEEAGESPAIGEVAPTFTRAIGTDPDDQDPDATAFVVSWAPVEDAVDYAVFVQTQGTDKAWKVQTLTDEIVNPTTGSAIGISKLPVKATAFDLDGDEDDDVTTSNWGAVVDFKDFATYTDPGKAGFGRIGVMAVPYKTNKNPSIVWSEEFFTFIVPTP